MKKKSLKTRVFRKTLHFFITPRKFYRQKVVHFSQNISGKKILEIGSGPLIKEQYPYSFKKYFEDKNEFTTSDIVQEYGHKIVDITKMSYREEFDVLLCLNVLEHVYDYSEAISNIYASLKIGGTVLIAVPAFYPLHDEPHDYWRFTEHSLKNLLSNYRSVHIKHRGIREFPIAYFIEALK